MCLSRKKKPITRAACSDPILTMPKGTRVPSQAVPREFVAHFRAGEDCMQGDCASRTHLPVPATKARAQTHLPLLFGHGFVSHTLKDTSKASGW